MKKQIHILEGIIILIIIFISTLLFISFIYNIYHEKVDTSYMWNINFTNLTISEGSKEGDIKLDNNSLILNVTLDNEEEFYEFTLDIENKGSLDAELNKISFNIENTQNILIYSYSYIDGTEIKEGDILYSNSTNTIIVRIEYPKQENKIYKSLQLKLTLSLSYNAIY